jgi:hypothetical protein
VSRPPTEHINTFTPRHILVAPPTHVAKHNTELLYTQHLLPRASHGRATSRRPHATCTINFCLAPSHRHEYFTLASHVALASLWLHGCHDGNADILSVWRSAPSSSAFLMLTHQWLQAT